MTAQRLRSRQRLPTQAHLTVAAVAVGAAVPRGSRRVPMRVENGKRLAGIEAEEAKQEQKEAAAGGGGRSHRELLSSLLGFQEAKYQLQCPDLDVQTATAVCLTYIDQQTHPLTTP
ncbi:hypothetical protein B296_00045455 [Ensete ventricosum]|uniref:Uncharacterized protein n=1 Tax=Ensete ventricosum TaxID=4639 RepID=A0A426X8P4_ENSVE|nr:hypothetical protein B296_00045455 [Ensete ventricosum]